MSYDRRSLILATPSLILSGLSLVKLSLMLQTVDLPKNSPGTTATCF
ncbi:MAG: hypothetical protein N3F67_02020 [Acidilobaceae archaeon]|nr:hypothetical protein [Acidilobaceae archaeon]